ncbi:MAG: polysaccharide biosynthesis tyrosine autokinase [Ignavibacterium sp.]|nr:polysaccharide biosynthesis tyrosine autokinase [Ignavibacterium sp.]MDW8374080.1 polysaccharide biosynthesis tyrosine autokinase [Ignavibacteriales bacterium]
MNNNNNNFNYVQNGKDVKQNELKDYIIIFFQKKFIVIGIFLVAVITSIIYSLTAINIYTASGSIKVSIPKSNPISGPLFEQFQEFGSDRFIANEIEVLKSRTIAEIAAKTIIDSFNYSQKNNLFYNFLKDPEKPEQGLKSFESIVRTLQKGIDIEQKRGLDIIVFKADSPSPYESALIVNAYINAYYTYNLKMSRQRYTLAKDFLEKQREDKAKKLKESENAVSEFQQKNNVVVLDEQARSLVEQISQLEAQMNAADIEAKSKQQALNEFRAKLEQKDKDVAKYIDKISAEPYIKALQEQIAKLEVQKELVVSSLGLSNPNNDVSVQNYNRTIKDLKKKLDEQMVALETGLVAYTPDDIRQLSMDVLKLDLEIKSAQAKAEELRKAVRSYEAKFNKLPVQSIEFARLERDRLGNEKLFTILEEKYQESLIAEQSVPSNVEIIDAARIPLIPSKPNRTLIIIIGFVVGIGFGVGFIFLTKYFDVTIRTPEDVRNRGANVLSWIPKLEDFIETDVVDHEIVVASLPDSVPAEAFVSTRTKIKYTRLSESPVKVILITSPTPKDGKTFICSNLAVTYGLSGERVLALDLDLRRPRLHQPFKLEKRKGVTDYLFNQASFEEIVQSTEYKGVDFISAGSKIPNPAEVISSNLLKDLIEKLKNHYDYIFIDSPPIIAVSDAAIISQMSDITLLVASVNQTRLDLLEEAINTLNSIKGKYFGVILNRFESTNGYGSYYKYYYYYYSSSKPKKPKKVPNISDVVS